MKESDGLYCRPIVTARYDSSWDLYDQHLYRGGSRRIHTLRCLIGDDIFWPAVTDYLKTYHNKLVETDDFRKILEKHSHRNLTSFFDEWIYSPGYPKITATYEYSPGRQQVSIHAQQTQMDEKRGIKTFSMAISVDIAYMVPTAPHPVSSVPGNLVTPSSSTSTATTTSKVKWLKTELVFSEGATEAHLTISLPSPPLQIIFDKKQMYCFTLTMDPGFTVLRTMALHCWSVPHRIWAAQALLERGSPQELEVVSEMLLHREQHWGVIADVAVALAKQHRSHKATTILCKLLHSPNGHPSHQPRALMSIALALGQISDPRISTAIRQFLASRRYTTLHKVDEGALRAINSHSSLSSLAEAAESFQRKESSSAKLSSTIESDDDDDDDDDSDTENSASADIKLAPEAEGDNTIPYKTHARLLQALASQGDVSDEGLIVEQAERTRYGWLGIVRGSALAALAEYGTQNAFEYILEATKITQHQHLKARAAAITALASCVYKSKMSAPLLQRALHTLHLLLHDNTYVIRFTTVHALFKLLPAMAPSLAQESLSAIHHIRKSLSNQDRMWVKRKRLLVKGDIKAKSEKSLLSSAGSKTSSTPGSSAPVLQTNSMGPSMDEFLALKQELLALKARVTTIEEQLEEDDDDDVN
jgi:HEAT repeat protein